MKLSYKPIALLFAITSITFAACKKDKTTKDDFPKTLKFQGTTKVGTERVFTAKGEVTDAVVIARTMGSSGLNFTSNATYPGPSIVFTSKSTLQMTNKYSLVEGSGDLLLFASNESVFIPANDYLVKLAPLFKYPGLQSSGNDFIYRNQQVLHGDYSAVKISWIDFAYLHRNANGKNASGHVIINSNEFNIKGLSSLGELDTVVFRTYTYNYALAK
jgi:hypothetical protein